uniref:Uncharacterized protein n=1 Tax=Sphaerodactylus townsendi TaxID=933632 RepID=A0ACB8G1S7_9SAUR
MGATGPTGRYKHIPLFLLHLTQLPLILFRSRDPAPKSPPGKRNKGLRRFSQSDSLPYRRIPEWDAKTRELGVLKDSRRCADHRLPCGMNEPSSDETTLKRSQREKNSRPLQAALETSEVQTSGTML